MRLYATPLSHYSRKVRLLLDHYEVEYDLVSPGDVSGTDAARFGDNPVMKVPVLEDGDTRLLDSDHIAQYVARKYDPADRFGVLTTDPETLNLRAVMNAVMQEEVKLILAARTGLETTEPPFFRKARLAKRTGSNGSRPGPAASMPRRTGTSSFISLRSLTISTTTGFCRTGIPGFATSSTGYRPAISCPAARRCALSSVMAAACNPP